MPIATRCSSGPGTALLAAAAAAAALATIPGIQSMNSNSRADSAEIKLQLRAATDEAAARGVFGVPTYVVGDELFWGQDRLQLVEEALTR